VAHPEQAQYGRAIANGDLRVSIKRPPTYLYKLWKDSKGPVTSKFRRALAHEEREGNKADRNESKSWMDNNMAMNKQQMELRMAETVADSMERMSSR